MDDELKCPYFAKLIESKEVKKNCWNVQNIGIYEKISETESKQIGEYTYTYCSGLPFYPFQNFETKKWFALYSAEDYTKICVMSLPDCKKIWTNSDSFCPVQFYVPIIRGQNYRSDDRCPRLPNHDPKTWCREGRYPDDEKSPHTEAERKEYKELRDKQHKAYQEWHSRYPYESRYAPFGFVAGCHWGDDCSWKIEFLDLSDPYNVIHDYRFGYIELGQSISLKDAIDADSYDFDLVDGKMDFSKTSIRISIAKNFLLSGKEETE